MLDLHSKWCGELTLHYHGGLLVVCQGNFCSPSIGTYKLIWDNTYSNFYRKILRYKVDSIPPVLETNSGALSSTDESPNSDATSYDE
jgi:hypothetical protein